MKIGLYYRTIITDKNGKVVKRSRWRKSRSFVIGFLGHVNSYFARAGVSILNTGNVAKAPLIPIGASGRETMLVNAGDNDATYGFVVGTGTIAPTNSDYKLQTQIAHGIGAGQLDYGAHSFATAAVVGANVDFIGSRSFYNGSGATITVNEIGVYCYTFCTDSYHNYFCLIRDVITATAVLNTQTLTVQYTLRTTV